MALSMLAKKIQSKDLAGKRSGKLVVIKKSDKTNKRGFRAYWDCICDCGNFTVVITNKLQTNYTKSCGCLRFRRGSASHRYNGVGEITGSYVNNISMAAKNTGKEWNVSKEYLSNLYELQEHKCVLSGLSISFGNRYLKVETTASLDRIDNSKGYVEGNLQWIHKEINKMRGKLPVSEFLGFCKSITEHQKRLDK
jgi:hypothetical protein